MSKTAKLDVRLTADELREIERQARALNMPKSQFARLLLLSQSPKSPPPTSPASTTIDDSRIADVEQQIADFEDRLSARLADIDESLRASARAFESLLSQLAELVRVPSFREYRARAAADGVEKRQNESDEQFMLRLANRYFVEFKRWPDPTNQRTFGPAPAGVDLQKFPRQPPA